MWVGRWRFDETNHCPRAISFLGCTWITLTALQSEEACPSFRTTVVCWGLVCLIGPKTGTSFLRGNTWSVPVVALLLKGLLEKNELISSLSVQEVSNRCKPGNGATLQGRLWRRPWLRKAGTAADLQNEEILGKKLSTLVSAKGTDVLLTAPSSSIPKFQRLRTSVPARLWGWKTVCGWRWKHGQRKVEHMNRLELRALHSGQMEDSKAATLAIPFLHLTDSMVSLLVTNKGRSSSRKLYLVLQRMCAYVLASGNVCLLGYVNTDQNPADRPSRRPVKRRWLKRR